MKKTLLILLTCVLMLSLCGVSAAADSLPADVEFVGGSYAGAGEASFSPVGDVTIIWDADVSKKVTLTDGDVSDWAELGYAPTIITENQMVAWVGGESSTQASGMPAGWGIKAYFVADASYLYMIFDITDSNFTYGNSAKSYDGDALQLSVDIGGRVEDLWNTDSDIENPKGIFYSFSCVEDGAPIQIMRQESENDGMISAEKGDGVQGAARRTETGWSAEIALSWEQLYNDYCYKAWNESKIYIGSDAEIPLRVGMALNYINRVEPAGAITWAASTTAGITNEDGIPVVSWTVYDNGIQLTLPYQQGVGFNCDGFQIIYSDPVLPDFKIESDWIVTAFYEAPTEPPEAMPPESESLASGDPSPETGAPEEALDPELEAVLAKYNCTMTVGLPAAFLGILAFAAAILRKKD